MTSTHASQTAATDQIAVTPVHSRLDQSRFMELPWTLYRDDPNWVPPLRQNQKALLGFAKHPFFDFASIQSFLGWRNGEVCGRISAIVNTKHLQRHNDACGFFGFFECTDDARLANALFDAAGEWLAGHDLRTMRGPVNPSMNYECGLLVDGFDTPPTFMITYNPPYYGPLVERCGLEKVRDLYSYAEEKDFIGGMDPKFMSIVEMAKERFGISVRRINMSEYQREILCILDLFNKGTVGSWGFVPLTDGEAQHLGKDLRHLVVPELIRIAECDGKPVGALLGLLDFNPLIKRIDGRLFPFGFIRLLHGKKRIDRVRFLSSNVLPEYQRWGVGLVLSNAMEKDGIARGLKYGEFSWILDNNDLSRNTLEKIGLVRRKTHRLYERAIT